MKKILLAAAGVLFVIASAVAQKKALQTTSVPFASAKDAALFTEVQRATFQYFWNGAEPTSGLARERFHVYNIYPQND